MADEKKFKLNGILRGVAMTNGAGKSGKADWHRASLTIGKGEVSLKASTFDTDDIEAAKAANGKEVEVIFTKGGEGGKYRNIVKGGIKVVGQGESPITEQESLVEDGIEEIPSGTPVPAEQKAKNEEQAALEVLNDPIKAGAGVLMGKDDYWESKFNLDKKKLEFDKLKHMQIARESSWDRAVEYIGHMLKAVEIGSIEKGEFNKEELNFDYIKKLAYKIELDILAKEPHKVEK